jgi:sec-independent protein translocase protein TatC
MTPTDAPPVPPGAPRVDPAPERSRRDSLAVMSFVQHLEELRKTLFFLIGVAAVAATGGWFVAPYVLNQVVSPKLEHVYFSSPSEGFMIQLKVSMVIGGIVALPILLARLWGFIAPGLFKHERRAVVPVLICGAILFYAGILFSYYGVVPRMVDFFLSFSSNRITPLINVTEYFMFVAKFSLAFGLAFQLPLVIVLLAGLGIVSPERLWSQWRYGIIVIFIIAAWLTPPDAVSQCMMGVPLTVLYMASLVVAHFVARRRRRRQKP